MPEISRFLGIIIRMFYGDNEAAFSIETLEVIEGKLPARVVGLVVEWATLHQKELMENWVMCTRKENQSFKKIKPLV
jgi:hypothetical protein